MKYFRLSIFLLLLFATSFPLFSKDNDGYQVIDQVVATVANRAITMVDMEQGKSEFKRRKDIKKDKRNLDSQVLDMLINRAIIRFTAEDESITVSENQIQKEIKRQMEAQGIKSENAFKALVKKQFHLTWDEYLEEVANQLYMRQVVQIRVPVPPPSQESARDWYKKNRRKLGNKYLARVIQMKFKKGDYQDELRVSKAMKAARVLALKDFPTAAKKYSQHSSASRGGLLGWVRPEEIAMSDRFLAGAIVNSPRSTVSQVFVGSRGYYIVKVEKTAPIDFEEVYNYIMAFLYNENEQRAFAKWLKAERSKVAVQIFINNYQGVR